MSPGGTYVIYAHKDNRGRLIVGLCGRTRAVAEAAEDLRFARGLATDRSTEARVFGDVTWTAPTSTAPPRGPEDRLPRVAWIAASGGSEWRFESDAAGHIEGRLPPGRYVVRVEAPAEYTADGAWELHIPDARACRPIGVALDWKDSLSGRILDAAGRPVPGLRVHVVTDYPGSWRPYDVYTDAAGVFLFSDLGAGDHDLYVGTSILPHPIERTVHLARGEHQVIAPLTLPANTSLASIAGSVVDEAGRPLAGANVWLDEENAPFLGRVTTDADGRYRFTAVPGRAYRIEARMPLPPPDHFGDSVWSERIEAGAVAGPQPIVVRRPATP
jgi:protocatechuate 3,4-dioxygenase beta subunit